LLTCGIFTLFYAYVLILLQAEQDIDEKLKDDHPNGDKSGDNQSGASGGKKPSIISTIRHSLFGGSKSGPKPPDSSAPPLR